MPSPGSEVWEQVAAFLENQKQRIQEEIRNYPRPIAACDLQFNHLLEERAALSQELHRMRAAAREGRGGEDALKFLDAYVKSSSWLDQQAKQSITSHVKEELSRNRSGNDARLPGRL